ncbi:hypothetical protein HD806DRAFT_16350 [Xylariaceae sp. AK1471]|nr:hypothetical protein HD806DRAFT_16350 [Xylariaceae sp. AK1471]
MDPLSIVSLAAAAIQGLDFGSRLLSGAHEVYTSATGQKNAVIFLSKVSADFTTFTDDIEAKLHRVQHNEVFQQPLPFSETEKVTDETNDVLLRLCRESRDISRELQQILIKLQAHGTSKLKNVADSFRVALKTIASEKSIHSLEQRLNDTRSQITMALLAMTWGQAERNHATMIEIAEKQMSKLYSIDDATRKFGENFKGLVQGGTEECQLQAEELAAYLVSCTCKPNESMEIMAAEAGSSANASSTEETSRSILSKLHFKTMKTREEAIPKAYADTYRWIFEHPRCGENQEPLWSDFTHWLSGPSDRIYWITGKPGAGKSTLMKYVSTGSKLEPALHKWAGNADLSIATYYSWNAGNGLQKSQSGLLRTLLYQCLRPRANALLPVIFPGRWTALQLLKNLPTPSWTLEELMDGFRTLLSQAGKSHAAGGLPLKFALFIDGLDEFAEDHEPLTDLLREASSYPGVKVCVSSRPWNVFRDAFRQSPMLQLESLTRGDIERYVHGQFQKSSGFKELKLLQSAAAATLLDSIVNKAQGVFIWVAVVVRDVLRQLQDGDRLFTLQATVDGLPDDISQLFNVIWERISSSHRREAVRYISIVEVYLKYSLTPSSVALWLGEEEFFRHADEHESRESFFSNVATSFNRRIDGRTRGVLETYEWEGISHGRVDYMHRTARDWVRESWGSLEAFLGSDFDAHVELLRGEIRRALIDEDFTFSILPSSNQRTSLSHYLDKLISIAAGANNSPTNCVALLQILDKLNDRLESVYQARKLLDPDDVDFISPDSQSRESASWTRLCLNKSVRQPRAGYGEPRGTDVIPELGESYTQLTFPGLLAQWPVSNYVRAKVMQEPKVTHAQQSCAPLLVSLVAGGVNNDLYQVSPQPTSLFNPQRLNLLYSLLPLCPLDVIQATLDFIEKRMAERRLESSKDYMSNVKMIIDNYLASELSPVVQPTAETSTGPSSAAVASTKRLKKFSLTRQIKKLAQRK